MVKVLTYFPYDNPIFIRMKTKFSLKLHFFSSWFLCLDTLYIHLNNLI